jgi:hypothetical protein
MISAYYHAPVEGSPLMRGSDEQPGYLFSYVSAEARVPQDHLSLPNIPYLLSPLRLRARDCYRPRPA